MLVVFIAKGKPFLRLNIAIYKSFSKYFSKQFFLYFPNNKMSY